jgi:two-component sensor histidine kinase
LKKKDLFLFFFLPLIGIIIIFFILSSFNRSYIRAKVEALVEEQLQATAGILKVNLSHFLSEDYPKDEIFDLYSGEENIYYMALLNENKEILAWRSRFEGFLPLSQKKVEERESWIIDSPAGKIFNIFSPFETSGQKTYYIYLGYSLSNLEDMITHSRRSFFVFFGIIAAIGMIFFLGVYQLQNHYLQKEEEAGAERKEKQRYREISAFTSGVAHEIKNPLNSLALLCELLERKMPDELKEEILSGGEEVRKISRIIDQFSATLKPLDLKKDKFPLKDLVADVTESASMGKDKPQVKIDYQEDSQVFLYADRDLIGQALLNMLRNSLQATNEGKIVVRAWRHRKKTFISLLDSGRGMTEEEKRHIFDPFFSGKKGGMGIGLYLTKKIVEAHEGHISCESQLGQGTIFSIQIPGG